MEYAGLEWEDKLYSMTGKDPVVDKMCWYGVKESLGFDFPNLPWLVDGDVKLTQTTAIIRHLARKTNLGGQSDDEKRRVDLMEAEWKDFCGPFVEMCYDKNFDTVKKEYPARVGPKLARFSAFLGDKPWFAGNELTYVDFLMYEMFDQHKLLDPSILSKFGNLEQFMTRVEALPRIAEFMKSPKFVKYPLNNRHALFGG
ncbi:glutathione S-transferase Mu 5 isoform X2 [Folsomia candida]|uniref:glutathione transferase n=2 Tax=Folsomia candida TaxID=158441 RepID=A0A226CYE3_FOLCA|nr:glutathione S-transferase Mu 5 isoform X2 [Folsomia candida]XP_035701701.1 glutathione S-transferase Mu 5 isoform X2 [Folsomia candida]OXA37066.1 Glutathione S-transferase Mu 5 [Folsomia candida]